MNEDNKKKNKKTKRRYFQKCCVFGFFLNEMECERSIQDFSNKVIVLNATNVLISIEKCQQNEFQTILYNWSISITTKQICEGNR